MPTHPLFRILTGLAQQGPLITYAAELGMNGVAWTLGLQVDIFESVFLMQCAVPTLFWSGESLISDLEVFASESFLLLLVHLLHFEHLEEAIFAAHRNRIRVHLQGSPHMQHIYLHLASSGYQATIRSI